MGGKRFVLTRNSNQASCALLLRALSLVDGVDSLRVVPRLPVQSLRRVHVEGDDRASLDEAADLVLARRDGWRRPGT